MVRFYRRAKRAKLGPPKMGFRKIDLFLIFGLTNIFSELPICNKKYLVIQIFFQEEFYDITYLLLTI